VEFVGIVVSSGTTRNKVSATGMHEVAGLMDTSLHTRRGKHESENGHKGVLNPNILTPKGERETCQ
jgi:hypothetical protein